MFSVHRYTGAEEEEQQDAGIHPDNNSTHSRHRRRKEQEDTPLGASDKQKTSSPSLSGTTATTADADDDSIVVLSQRNAKKLKAQHARTAEVDNRQVEQQRLERKAEKQRKREARRQTQRPALPQDQPSGDTSTDITVLMTVKNSTVNKNTTVSVLSHPASSVPSPLSAVRVGQQKKDPAVRAAERAARKRQRMLDERRAKGEGEEVIETEMMMEDEIQAPRVDAELSASSPATTVKADSNGGATDTAGSDMLIDDESASVLHAHKTLSDRPSWMSQGVHIDSDLSPPIHDLSLHPTLLHTLASQGIHRYFAIQATVIPVILHEHGHHDICVNAPTGSGKTLMYLLPVLHSLATRVRIQLRALILVPSRDLALQVKNELDVYAPPLGLRAAVAIGQQSFRKEQQALVQLRRNVMDIWEETDPLYRNFPPASTDMFRANADEYESNVDILVCTPGRLIDHLDGTTGFTLQHLQFLVIDEVDRLVTQHYSDWTNKIHQTLTAAQQQARLHWSDSEGVVHTVASLSGNQQQVQKILVSATLTANPAKLAALHLYHPLLFTESMSTHKKFSIPAGLKASFILCEAQDKPLILIHTLHSLLPSCSSTKTTTTIAASPPSHQVLIFTASIESTHRLARLLDCYGDFTVAEYSSSLTQHQRSQLLSSFRQHQISSLICSDVMSRGMDIPSVSHVINYDVPVYIHTYIHRVGRTARGHSQGNAITLVKPVEYTHFIQMLKKAANSYLTRKQVVLNAQTNAQDKALIDRYTRALRKLKQVLKEERQGKIGKQERISAADAEEERENSGPEDEEADEEEEGIDPAEWRFPAANAAMSSAIAAPAVASSASEGTPNAAPSKAHNPNKRTGEKRHNARG